MNILVLNGSPKGKNSITLQTVLYLQKRYPKHQYNILNVGQQIKSFEKDFTKAIEAFEKAEVVLFAYPVYTMLSTYQVHRFIELMKENDVDLRGKYACQITTSKHFFDMTAHKFIEENCYDFGMKYLGLLSADMDDLQSLKGQRDADCFFKQLIFDIDHGIYKEKTTVKTTNHVPPYKPSLLAKEKSSEKDVVVVTNGAKDDENLNNMIADFISASEYNVRLVNVREYPFSGGCLGCMQCSVSGKCVYKDGFDDFLRTEIQNADALILAFTIENHYTHSSMKCYDDRQFCNGHRAVTHGKVTGYIISGDLENEFNLKTVVEARSDASGMYLCGVATDEKDTAKAIEGLANSMSFALSNKLQRPQTFYGVGGTKIFRDLVYLMQGLMKADHKFYKENGIYDFPHNNKKMLYGMKFLGAAMSIPSIQKEMKSKMSEFIIKPYKELLEKTQEDTEC